MHPTHSGFKNNYFHSKLLHLLSGSKACNASSNHNSFSFLDSWMWLKKKQHQISIIKILVQRLIYFTYFQYLVMLEANKCVTG